MLQRLKQLLGDRSLVLPESFPEEIAFQIARRIHPRAKRIKLQMRHGQLMLTLPPRVDAQQIQQFLQAARPWLERQMSARAAPVNFAQLTLDLPLLAASWGVVLRTDIVRALVMGQELHVSEDNPASNLKQFVRYQAHIYLPQRLALLAAQHQLSYEHCQLRHARGRWGSCSSHKSITLNPAILLLPVTLVDYVLCHELCHTLHMDHSPAFWQRVAVCMPNYEALRKELNTVQLPAWW